MALRQKKKNPWQAPVGTAPSYGEKLTTPVQTPQGRAGETATNPGGGSYTGLDYDDPNYKPPPGAPRAPDFESLIGGKGGFKAGAHRLDARSIDPSDIAGYGQFRDFATGTGPSEYAQEVLGQLGLRTSMARDRSARDAAGAAARARSLLGSRGGLTGGAQERLAGRAMDQALLGGQSARRAQMLGEADVLSRDAQSRQRALQDFLGFGADLAQYNTGMATQADQFNIQNALAQIERERQLALELYRQRGSIWGAGEKAKALRRETDPSYDYEQRAEQNAKEMERIENNPDLTPEQREKRKRLEMQDRLVKY